MDDYYTYEGPDRCGCGSDDIVASRGGEPYCEDCWRDVEQAKRDRKLCKEGLWPEPFTEIAGCLRVFRRGGEVERVEVDADYLCPELFEEVADVFGAAIVDTQHLGRTMVLTLSDPKEEAAVRRQAAAEMRAIRDEEERSHERHRLYPEKQ